MVICCNALKKDGTYGEGQNRTAEREFSPLTAPGVTCDFFVDYHQGIFGKSRVHSCFSAQRKGNHGNEIVSRSHWKQPVDAYNFFWNGVVERH
jgi:hypothetical protein